MCGTVEVAMATRLGSEGLALIAAGEKATHALELTMKSQRPKDQLYQHLANQVLGASSLGELESVSALGNAYIQWSKILFSCYGHSNRF